jgi:hypothetical protein
VAVRGIDVVEGDAAADVGGVTCKLAAMCLLSRRPASPPAELAEATRPWRVSAG